MKQGDVVLIWGASGGLGSYATQFALNGGATPICVVSSEEKAQICRDMGAELVIDRNADMYEGFIVGVLVVLAVSLSQVRGAAGNRKQFFPGALGGVMVGILALLAALVTSFFVGPKGVGIAFGSTLLLLALVKAYEARAQRR